MTRFKLSLLALPALFLLGGCQDTLTYAETREALDEAALSNQALVLAAGSVEICTNFTIGQAVEAAADELRAFIESQLPCAAVTLDGARLTIEYGAYQGNCTYHGQTFSGTQSIEITSAAAGDLEVHHEWTDLSNGKLTVSGSADVSWSAADSSRHVVHQLNWTRLKDGKQVTGSGDRTQTALPAGIATGFSVQGDRWWTSDLGDWNLDIDNVEMRWIDPVPQAGSYSLATPFNGKSATLTFVRQDEDTIKVTITSGRISYSFFVSKSGDISDN